jgi:DNA-directed RNA polymerase specialized sigma subunit
MSNPLEKIARNEEILKDRVERNMTHLQIAEKHNISKARVKQILDWIRKKQNRGK